MASSPGEAKRNPGAADEFAPDFATLHPGYNCAAPVHPTPPPSEPAPGRAQARPGWEGEEAAPADIVPRLQSAVARVLPAIDATVARLAGGAHHPRDMAHASRTLSALMRTLRELNALLTQHNARPDDMRCECREMSPEDMDAFRDDLARRIDAFMLSRPDEDFAPPGSGLPLDRQSELTLPPRRWTARPGA